MAANKPKLMKNKLFRCFVLRAILEASAAAFASLLAISAAYFISNSRKRLLAASSAALFMIVSLVWGANHFISKLPYDSSCWIVWDKDNSGDFADCELAWTSLNTAVRKFKWRWNGMLQQNMKDKEVRIHPTQKPIALYEWIFQNYTSEGNLILDTHLGSGSSRIAAEKNKLNFVGCEIDKEYFDAQEARYKEFKSQLRLW